MQKAETTRTVYVLLPAYNEEKGIEKVVKNITAMAESQKWSYRFIVCNDGSRDGTAEVLERIKDQYPIDIITHKLNRGLGETARDLMERAAELADDQDVLIRLDCDNTHDPQFMPAMLDKLDQGYDVVIASRFQPGGGQVGVSPYRALISRAANFFMFVFFPIPGIREYSCGYRAYRAAMIKQAVAHYGNGFIQLKGLGFTCTLEKLIKLKLLGARFAETAFVLRYDRKESYSKMITSITTLGYLVMVVVCYWPWGGWWWSERKRRVAAAKSG